MISEEKFEPCAGTAEGDYECERDRRHPGAHIAPSGHWWPWGFEDMHYRHPPYTPLARRAGVDK
jgi:hypothetical protein